MPQIQAVGQNSDRRQRQPHLLQKSHVISQNMFCVVLDCTSIIVHSKSKIANRSIFLAIWIIFGFLPIIFTEIELHSQSISPPAQQTFYVIEMTIRNWNMTQKQRLDNETRNAPSSVTIIVLHLQ